MASECCGAYQRLAEVGVLANKSEHSAPGIITEPQDHRTQTAPNARATARGLGHRARAGVVVVSTLFGLTSLSGHGAPNPHPRHPHPRFARDRGSITTAIPDLPESGIQLSTIEYCKGVEFRLPQCLTLRLIVLPKLINLRRPAMSDDAVDYGSSSDESDQVPSRLPARAESCILAHDLS